MSDFYQLVQKDVRSYRRTVAVLQKLPSLLARVLAWLLLRLDPHGPKGAAARRYEFVENDEVVL